MINAECRKANRDYWRGYAHAKRLAFEGGMGCAREAYCYGLNGRSPAYCRGFLAYIERR